MCGVGDDTVPQYHDQDGFGWYMCKDKSEAIMLTPQSGLPVARAKIEKGDLVITPTTMGQPKRYHVPLEVIDQLRQG